MNKYKKNYNIYKVGKNIITFSDTGIEKHKFYQHKNSISIYDVDINKIVVSGKFPFAKKDFKYFISYKDVEKVRPLWVHIQDILMKLNMCCFEKKWWIPR